MRATQNPQYVLVALFNPDPRAKASTMQINLRQVTAEGIRQRRRRLALTIQGGSQLVEVVESKDEILKAVDYYRRVRDEVERTGGIILRDAAEIPRGKLILTEDGDLQHQRIVPELPTGGPRG